MSTGKLLLIVSALSTVLSCVNKEKSMATTSKTAESDAVKLTFFYLPFPVETYLPVTTESIEKNARCVVSFEPSSDELAALRSYLNERDPGEFDEKRVRLKVVGLEEQELFIDAMGGLRKGATNQGRLSEDSLGSLQQLIERICIRMGCDPHAPPK